MLSDSTLPGWKEGPDLINGFNTASRLSMRSEITGGAYAQQKLYRSNPENNIEYG